MLCPSTIYIPKSLDLLSYPTWSYGFINLWFGFGFILSAYSEYPGQASSNNTSHTQNGLSLAEKSAVQAYAQTYIQTKAFYL